MTPVDFFTGVVFVGIALGAYELGKEMGRREMRKLARFRVDLEEWAFEEEPTAAPRKELVG